MPISGRSLAKLDMSWVLYDSAANSGFCVWKNSQEITREFPSWLSGLRTQLISMRMKVQSPVLLSGLRIWHCHKMQHRLQIWLRSGIAVAWAGGCSSNSTLSLGTSICHRRSTKKQKKKKKIGEFPGGLVLKEPALSLLCYRFSPWPRNLDMLWAQPKNNEKILETPQVTKDWLDKLSYSFTMDDYTSSFKKKCSL